MRDPLNQLINDIRAKYWSNRDVYVAPLHRKYPEIRSKSAFKDLINSQSGKYTLSEMAKVAYDKHSEYTNKNYTYEELYNWIYDLYVVKTLRGCDMEERLLNLLKHKRPSYDWSEADDTLDVGSNVDIVGVNGDDRIYIQVKPESYKNALDKAKEINKYKEDTLNAKLHYAYYNSSNEWSWD